MRRKSNWDKYDWGKSEKARRELRRTRLSVPITPERIAIFVKHLVAVSFGADSECWFYVGCGKGTTLPESLSIGTTAYGNVKFNRESVGPHVFALCASEGIKITELAGFDVHHAAQFGRCVGYRCVNPDHLEKVPTKVHRGTQGGKDSLIRFQTKVVREVLDVPSNVRRPAEHLTLTGAGSRRRFLAGQPFLIRGGVLVDVLEDVPAESAEPIPA
jgi:hypothetical protein